MTMVVGAALVGCSADGVATSNGTPMLLLLCCSGGMELFNGSTVLSLILCTDRAQLIIRILWKLVTERELSDY